MKERIKLASQQAAMSSIWQVRIEQVCGVFNCRHISFTIPPHEYQLRYSKHALEAKGKGQRRA